MDKSLAQRNTIARRHDSRSSSPYVRQAASLRRNQEEKTQAGRGGYCCLKNHTRQVARI